MRSFHPLFSGGNRLFLPITIGQKPTGGVVHADHHNTLSHPGVAAFFQVQMAPLALL
jgi:hypothetical protein